MDPTSLTALYALLATSGLVSMDSYVNSRTIQLETTVAEPLSHEGYDTSVVEAIFMSEVTRIINTPSLASLPKISTMREKPFSVAAAEVLHVPGALRTAQSYVGLEPPWLTASIIVDERDTRISLPKEKANGNRAFLSIAENISSRMIITGFSPDHGYFAFSAAQADRKFDEMITNGAWEAVRYLDPYYAVLARFVDGIQKGVSEAQLRNEVLGELNSRDTWMSDHDRALMQNLVGISELLDNNLAAARPWFEKTVALDPVNPVGWLNLGFLDVQEDHFEDALEKVDKVIPPAYWPFGGNKHLLASAYVTRGVALGELHRYAEAADAFKAAIGVNPDTASAYLYWARMLRAQGRVGEAQELFEKAKSNEAKFINYPEVALLYFWLTEAGDKELRRRLNKVEDL